MSLTKPQQHVLFLLGLCQEAFKQKFENKPLKIYLSKTAFIEIAIKANLAEKLERALYQNLEMLGKKKCIRYSDKNLELTEKGNKRYNKIKEEIKPYLSACFTVSPENVARFTTKARTKLDY